MPDSNGQTTTGTAERDLISILKVFFGDFDQLADGTVSQDVIESVLCEVAGFTDDESCQLIARINVNSAGRLNINEFLRELVARRVDSNAGPSKDSTEMSPKSEAIECAISMEAGTVIECAICMEAISEVTTLPCRCKFDYCQPCWDKALANSFSQCGQARCPSCRSLVRVDFDPEKTCLVFSAETVDMTYAAQRELRQTIVRDFEQGGGMSDSELEGRPSLQTIEEFARNHDSFEAIQDIQKMRNDTVTKLRHQAMPALKAALRRHGEANPSLPAILKSPRETLCKLTDVELEAFLEASSASVEEGSKQPGVVDALVENASAVELCSCWAQQNCPAPRCVCGSFLQRVDAVERFRQSPAGERLGSHSNDEILCHLRHLQQRDHTIIICDICEESLPITSSVWTCRNRTSTILHATSYDICDKCFVRHVCNENEERVEPETATG